jgi:hypothetical protein
MARTSPLPALVPSTAPVRLLSPDTDRVRIDLDAYCWTCAHRHRLGRTPQDFTQEMWEWEAKHRDHAYEFLSPSRRLPPHYDDRGYTEVSAPWWLTVQENANVKLAYAASTPLTITLASLASAATFLVGRESAAIVNTTDLYIDGRIMVKITTGASAPTVDTEIRVYGVQPLDDTPTWPDTMTGSDAGRTVTNAYILDSAFILLGSTAVSASTAVGYPIRTLTLAEAFGFVPKRFSVFVTHNTGQNLHATGSLHSLVYIAAYLTSV